MIPIATIPIARRQRWLPLSSRSAPRNGSAEQALKTNDKFFCSEGSPASFRLSEFDEGLVLIAQQQICKVRYQVEHRTDRN